MSLYMSFVQISLDFVEDDRAAGTFRPSQTKRIVKRYCD